MSKTSHSKAEILQGTLDLMVLKTLDTMGPMHGFGIAQRIQQVSGETLYLNLCTACWRAPWQAGPVNSASEWRSGRTNAESSRESFARGSR